MLKFCDVTLLLSIDEQVAVCCLLSLCKYTMYVGKGDKEMK